MESTITNVTQYFLSTSGPPQKLLQKYLTLSNMITRIIIHFKLYVCHFTNPSSLIKNDNLRETHT